MKRKIGIAIGVAIIVMVALWLWHRGSREQQDAVSHEAAATAGTVSGAAQNGRLGTPAIRGGTVQGTVRDEANVGIAGVRVCASRHWTTHFCAATDDRGVYRIDQLPAGRFTVFASKEGYLPEVYRIGRREYDFALRVGQTRSAVDFVLEKGGALITGLVTDVQGTPLDHASVGIGVDDTHNLHGPPYAFAETDDRGTFSAWGRPGANWVSASADGFEGKGTGVWAPGEVIVRLLPSYAQISGIVIDAVTRQPLAGTLIDIGDSQTKSDTDGTFGVSWLSPGEYRACIAPADGHGCAPPVRVVLSQHVDGVTIVGTRERKDPLGYRVEGKVVIAGPNKAPCPKPDGSLQAVNSAWGWKSLRLQDDGRLEAQGLRPGRYQLYLECEGYIARATYDDVVVTDRDVTGLVWEVEEGGRITGTVRSANGKPVANADVWMMEGGPRHDDLTDRNGKFELIGLVPGTHRFKVISDAGLSAQDGYVVNVPPRATVVRDITLSESGSITGTVIDELGQPVNQAHIALSSDGKPGHGTWGHFDRHEATSSGNGSFVLAGVRQGRFVLKVTAAGVPLDVLRGAEVHVPPGKTATTQLVVEAARGTITGSVVDHTGAPQEGIRVTATREDATRKSASDADMTTSAGTFKLSSLAKGRYTISARRSPRDDGDPDATQTQVSVGTGVVLRLAPPGTSAIAGVMTGLKSPRVRVEISGANVRRDKVLNCPDGRFTLDQLPAGHFQLSVENEELIQREEFDLRAGESITVQIRFKRVTVSGRLINAFTRAPVPGIRVTTNPSAGTDPTSDSTGRFVIYGVTPGTIQIRSHSPPMALWRADDIERIATRVIGDADTDLGDLPIIPNRLRPWEVAGKLGFELDNERRITAIDPAGPAAKSGLVIGDIITTCDGFNLAGPTAVSWTLISRVRAGTPLLLGVQRGIVATLVTAP